MPLPLSQQGPTLGNGGVGSTHPVPKADRSLIIYERIPFHCGLGPNFEPDVCSAGLQLL